MNLDDVLAKLGAMPEKDRAAAEVEAWTSTAAMKWIPNPGPQTEAYFHPADILLYGGQGGGGKALALDTPIATPDGWATMDGLVVGDVVFDKDGASCRVTAVSLVMLGRPCYRVTFSDGASVVADEDHLWWTFTMVERLQLLCLTPEWRANRRTNRPSRAGRGVRLRPDVVVKNQTKDHAYLPPPIGSTRTTREIARTLMARPAKPHLNHSVRIAGALQTGAKQLAIDPYLLGAWLGDGKSSASRMTMAEDAMIENVTAVAGGSGWAVKKGKQLYDYGVTGGMLVALRGYDLINNKHIPSVYLRASVDQRLALLQGLMDTDGYVKPSGNCEFTTTTPALRDGVLEVLLSLGIHATCSEGRAMLRGKDCGPKYRVKFTTHIPVFRLERKAARQENAKLRQTVYHRYIKSVEQVHSVPVKCISVDSPSRTYLCGWEMIPTHNSDFGLGLAFTAHRRSLILRRQYSDLSALLDRAVEINGSKDGYNGSPPPRLRTADGRHIQFAGNQHPGDERSWQGHAFDLKVFDEAVHFLESQVRFHLGWLRSTEPGQRVRAILPTNPPTDASGDWIIGMFRPWLDLTHSNPAKHGEMRWFVTAPDGSDLEVDGPEPIILPGTDRELIPMSRTFLPAKLSDNPYLIHTGYQAKLDALPEPIRSAVRDGNFMAARADADFQVIPMAWILAAQARWQPDGWKPHAMTACGLDIGAGRDETVLAMRYGGWYAPIEAMTGESAEDPAHAAAMVVRNRKDNCPVVVDVGGGFGGPSMMLFKENGIACQAFNAAGASKARTRDGALSFVNKRAESWWKMREELDPGQEGGSVIALPPDQKLAADLAAPVWKMTVRGIQIESKDEIRDRLRRSPDRGDAVVMAMSEGQIAAARALRRQSGFVPKVVMGGSARRIERR